MTRADREREWRGGVAAAGVDAPRMAVEITLRFAEGLEGDGSWYEDRLRSEGMDPARVAALIDRLTAATDAAWWRELEARRAALGVERMMPWDLARPILLGAPAAGEAAARLGFDLASLGVVIAEGTPAATEVVEGRVRVTAPRGAARTLLHELGHALLLGSGTQAEAQASPLQEGVAELVAGLAPMSPADALGELRLALARAAFERALYEGEPPELLYWQWMDRIVGVTCDDAPAAWARLRHVETHPTRLAAYVVGAALAAHLRRAAAGHELRIGSIIRDLAAHPGPWEQAITAAAGEPFVLDGAYGADALLGELPL